MPRVLGELRERDVGRRRREAGAHGVAREHTHDCRRIRLCGIDTPERDQPGYASALRALTALAAVEELRCIPVGAGPSATAGEMIARGHACDLTQFSRGHYVRKRSGRAC